MQKDLHLKAIEEAKCINKLAIKNRKRIREFSELLNLEKRTGDQRILLKKDFESYERKKLGLFSWAKTSNEDEEEEQKDKSKIIRKT